MSPAFSSRRSTPVSELGSTCRTSARSPGAVCPKRPISRSTKRCGPVTPTVERMRRDVDSSPCAMAHRSCMKLRTSPSERDLTAGPRGVFRRGGTKLEHQRRHPWRRQVRYAGGRLNDRFAMPQRTRGRIADDAPSARAPARSPAWVGAFHRKSSLFSANTPLLTTSSPGAMPRRISVSGPLL